MGVTPSGKVDHRNPDRYEPPTASPTTTGVEKDEIHKNRHGENRYAACVADEKGNILKIPHALV